MGCGIVDFGKTKLVNNLFKGKLVIKSIRVIISNVCNVCNIFTHFLTMCYRYEDLVKA